MSSNSSNASLILSAIAVAYLFLFCADRLCRSCLKLPYILCLQNWGLEIKLFQIKWFSQGRINRFFSRVGTWKPSLLRLWFTTGAYVSTLILFPAMVLLVKTLVENLIRGDEEGESSPVRSRISLEPVLPGINMPLSDLGYYFLTLLTCSVIHEVGHAIAAVNEDVRVLGFGMNILFVLPVAYVSLPTEKLGSLKPPQQLRIFSAGIWHNLILTCLGYLALVSIPTLVSPWYSKGLVGVSVYHVKTDSSLNQGPTGLNVGDVITAVNECPVLNREDWRYCISKTIINPSQSYCLESGLVKDKKDPVDCCSKDGGQSPSSLCFRDSVKNVSSCLPVRQILEELQPNICNSTCNAGYCMAPILDDYNSSRLVQVKRKGSKDFLFVGHAAEIYYDADVTDYTPHSGFFPVTLMLIPPRLELLTHYIASFSGALAVLNVVPCFLLDGQYMTRVLVDILFSCYDSGTRSVISLTLTIVGTVLLILNIIVGVWQLF